MHQNSQFSDTKQHDISMGIAPVPFTGQLVNTHIMIIILCYFKRFPAENKSGIALLLLVMLLDKKYNNGGVSLLQFLEVMRLYCKLVQLKTPLSTPFPNFQQFWSATAIAIRMSLPVSHAELNVAPLNLPPSTLTLTVT